MKVFRPGHSVTLTPSIVVFTVCFLLLLYFLYFIRSIVLLMFLSFVLMTALHPTVRLLERKLRVPRTVAISLVYVGLLLLLALALLIVVPPLAEQIQALIINNNLPFLKPIQDDLKNFKFNLLELDSLMSSLGSSVTTVMSIITSAFSGLIAFFTFLVASFYMMLDREHLYKRVAWLTKDKQHLQLAKEFVDSVELQLGGWVRGQLILMLVIGVITYVGLLLLSVPYALPLALLAGLLEILPNLGPTIAAVPAVILGFVTGGPILGVIVILFSVIIQQIENNFIVPKIMKDNVDVSPLATIVTIIVGLELGGVFGALIAVPVYIILRTVYSMALKAGHAARKPDSV